MNRIGITMGDPAGVGPEVILRALADAACRDLAGFRVYGHHHVFSHLAGQLGLPMDFELRHCAAADGEDVRPGAYTPTNGRTQVACLEAAADDLARGETQGLVTGPIHKRALADAGAAGPGHTEWLAQRFGARRPVMMLAGPRLRVVLATTHLPLREVPGALCAEDLIDTILVSREELSRFFVAREPRLALAALNPHGETDGRPGQEEREILLPVVEALQRRGLDISGPISADTVFAQAAQGRFDCVVALYHDQGLAALKTLHFADAVNVTLGLGLVRTSPDHGPAYDIAWQGAADASSMKAAVATAAAMIAREDD